MRCWKLEPEVAGGLGKDSLILRNKDFTEVKKLHYVFDGWLGDELIESTPCFIVTNNLAKVIKKNKLTGISFDKVKITKSEEFNEMHPNKRLPAFLWMKIVGNYRKDDMFMFKKHLIVSDRTLKILKSSSLKNCLISQFEVK